MKEKTKAKDTDLSDKNLTKSHVVRTRKTNKAYRADHNLNPLSHFKYNEYNK